MDLILTWLLRRDRSTHRRRQALLAERERLLSAWRGHRRLRRTCAND
jgi:hypothetical protein